jgi:hypothetical protein
MGKILLSRDNSMRHSSSVSAITPHSDFSPAWRFTSRQPMSSSPPNSSQLAKKAWGMAGRVGAVLAAMGVAWGIVLN